MISTAIQQLVNYGLDTGLILPDDEIYIRNQLLMTMQLDDFTAPEGEVCYTDLESILKTLVDDAVARGVCEDNSTARDLFDTKLMGVLTPRPSIVRANFEERYENEGPQAATDWFYKFSQDTDYIRRYRIKRDLKWVTKTEYGDLDITINLSKPEKDPKAIAAAKLAPQSAYPKCQLCVENEGYAGRMNHPARENHRIIPLTINDSAWNFQYSPYVYYNEHCIVFNSQHTPMKIERATFRKLLDFVSLFPHYFVGSNADLPIVGGSILSHDHFQGGHYEFAMAKAPIEKSWVFPGFEDVEAGIVHWPMSCIRLTCADDERLVELADRILAACPHCFNTLKNEYPQFEGGTFPVTSHVQFIAKLLEEKRISPKLAQAGSVTFHDACYLARHNGIGRDPRTILETIGVKLKDPEKRGCNAMCCGAGGAQIFMDKPSRINILRLEQLNKTGTDEIAVSCPHCLTMLTSAQAQTCGRDETPKPVRDIAEIVAQALTQSTVNPEKEC